MKLDMGTFITENHPLFKLWETAGLNMTVEYGIRVQIILTGPTVDEVQRLYFKVDNYEFECLKDLRKALENKAFL
jgi:hypothetical protein